MHISNERGQSERAWSELQEAAEPEWATQSDLDTLLPPRKLVRTLGSIDRYGFLHLLAARCGLRAPRRAFAEWVHGWMWDENPTAESLACSSLHRELPVVVRNERERAALVETGFRRVYVGGLPFAYVGSQHSKRHLHALLAIPPHSAEVERLSSQQSDYMDYLESIRESYDGVYVSIFHLDWNGPMHRAAVKRGLHAIPGARPDDANSLLRMRALFEAFEMVTSNTIGSHFVYALYSGCRFSFCGPRFTYDADVLLANGNANRHSAERIARLIQIQQPEYLEGRFGRFFVDAPASGVSDVCFAAREVGEGERLDRMQIMDVLGWGPGAQLKGYLSGGIRRITRALRRGDVN